MLNKFKICHFFYFLILIEYCWTENGKESCFCELNSDVDHCTCSVNNVDSLNNLKLYPRLQNILQRDYFKFFKVNLNKDCPFWKDNSQCSSKDCHVNQCEETQLPDGIKDEDSKYKHSKESQGEKCDDNKGTLGKLDRTISIEDKEAFDSWKKHDDAQDNFCELDDDSSESSSYVDLQLNPERYTGYNGPSAHKIWNSIYEENCFKPEANDYIAYIQSADKVMCLEKRVFYRLVSGLHSSISTHLTAIWQFKDPFTNKVTWGPNVKEFKRRFDPVTTDGEGPQRLKNLYFTYLVELRAIAKAAPYLNKESYYTGNQTEDRHVKNLVKEFLSEISSFPAHFDETQLFKDEFNNPIKLKEEFKSHFRNISKIMDCVGCDKCRLWGKLQTRGLGTALKILFTNEDQQCKSPLNTETNCNNLQLKRTEIVSLFNAFGRLSRSIHEINQFRSKLN
ncbi:DgyrCDS7759 [Dimorphilus gyrociliatus]|uniref:DgyrCDS7759 n=1 Tax=Dimorphilus gyrociliatus TaxID=2664684 RepID=A0A7I8VU97_9ANNE|nr:DgyrCDS7759 [Dimorphilus gyrociliatus]